MFVSLLVFIVWFSCKCTDNIFYMQAPVASFLMRKIFHINSRSPLAIPIIQKPQLLDFIFFYSRNTQNRCSAQELTAVFMVFFIMSHFWFDSVVRQNIGALADIVAQHLSEAVVDTSRIFIEKESG